jgi:ComEC/Rec2-related protein
MALLSSSSNRYSLSAYQAFLVPALLAWVLGVWLAHNQLGMVFMPWPVVLGVVLLTLTLALTANKRWIGQACLWVLAFIGGGFYLLGVYPLVHHWVSPNSLQYQLPLYQAQVQGHIINYQSNPTGTGLRKVTLSVQRVNGLPLTGCAYSPRLSLGPSSSLLGAVGQAVTLTGTIVPPKGPLFTGGYSQRQYLTGLGIEGVFLQDGPDPASPNTPLLNVPQVRFKPTANATPWYWHLLAWAQQCRQHITVLFTKALPSPQAQILGGMVLGDKAIPVDYQTKQHFIQTGLIHLLAASGMNVAVVVGGCLWLGKTLKLPRVPNILVALLALAGYCVLTGLPPSIVRSGSMLTLALLLKAWDKTLSPLLLLSLAVALVVLLQPAVLLSVGFQFSCLTTLAIVGLLPPLQPVLGHYSGRFWAGLVLVPLVAQASILPISAYTFNTINVQSVPLNIIALPLTAGLTLLGFVSALCGLFMPWGGPWVSYALASLAYLPVTGLLALANWGSTLPPWHAASVSPLGLLLQHVTLVLGAVLASGWLLPRWPTIRKVSLLLALISVMLLSNGVAPPSLQLDWLPLSSRMGAWVVLPKWAASPLVLVPHPPNTPEQLTLQDYLGHRAIPHATLWVATQWQQGATMPTPPAMVRATWGQAQLAWGYHTIITDPTVRIETSNGCLVVPLGPSPSSLWPVPRLSSCDNPQAIHTVLQPTRAYHFWQAGQALRYVLF